MSDDPRNGLEARDDFLWITRQWPRLTAALAGTTNSALTGMNVDSSPDPALVIDVYISDLMHELTSVTKFYARILMGETTWTPTTSSMPGLLIDVANRYGHFIADDDLARGFTDDAHDWRTRVTKTLNRPAPPTYIGPCQTLNCEGELRMREDEEHARCPNCGTITTHTDQRDWLEQQMADRLLTGTEIIQALKTLDIPVAESTIWRWIEKDKLTEAEEGTGLYPLTDAIELAKARRRPRNAA